MNLCTEGQNLSDVLLPDEGAENACSCSTQVLETNAEWKIKITVVFMILCNLKDSPIALYPIISQLYPLLTILWTLFTIMTVHFY